MPVYAFHRDEAYNWLPFSSVIHTNCGKVSARVLNCSSLCLMEYSEFFCWVISVEVLNTMASCPSSSKSGEACDKSQRDLPVVRSIICVTSSADLPVAKVIAVHDLSNGKGFPLSSKTSNVLYRCCTSWVRSFSANTSSTDA